MKKNQKTCIILAMCLIFLMPGYASSNEEKVDFQSTLSDKVQTGKRPKYQSGLEFPWTQWEFSMDVPRSNPQIDSEAVENTFGPILGYKPIYLNPYTKKEITGYNWALLGSFQQELQLLWTDGKYSMRVLRPNLNIDRKIVKNTYDPNIDYKLRVINPYVKKEITNLKGPYWGSFQDKFQPEGTEYKTPMSSPVK